MNKSNSKKAYHLVKYLTLEKQGRSTTSEDMCEKCFAEEQEISQQNERLLLRAIQL